MHWLISGTEEGPDQWVGQISQSRKYMDAGKSHTSKHVENFLTLQFFFANPIELSRI